MEKYTMVLKNWSIYCTDIFGTFHLSINWKRYHNIFLKANWFWLTPIVFTVEGRSWLERMGPIPCEQFVLPNKVYTFSVKYGDRDLGHMSRGGIWGEDRDIEKVQKQQP